jgi:hypothetical protein
MIRGVKKDRKYKGDFCLITQVGHRILQTEYDERSDKIKLTFNTLDNSKIAQELLEKTIELSDWSEHDFLSKVDLGKYMYTKEGVLSLEKNIGINIEVKPLMPIEFKAGEIRYNSGFFTLYNNKGEIFMNCIEGLLHTDYYPENIDWDIIINDLPLSKILHLRPFNIYFNIEGCADGELCNILKSCQNPLKVNKPSVTTVTNQRLNINYPVRSMETEFNEIGLEVETSNDFKESNFMDLYQFARELNDDEIQDMRNIVNEPMNSLTDFILDPNLDLNILKTMTRQRITYQPKKILERILNFKYQIISKMVTTVNMINKRTIIMAKRTFNEIGIIYSLIYAYDRQFSNTDAPSPDGCEIRVNPYFQEFLIDNLDDEID